MATPDLRVKTLVFADSAMLDAYTSKPILIGLFTNITIPKDAQKVTIARMSVLLECALVKQPAEYDSQHDIRITVTSASGNDEFALEMKNAKIEKGRDGLRGILNVGPVAFQHEGVYSANVTVDGVEIYRDPSMFRVSKSAD